MITEFDSSINEILCELEEAWDYNPYAGQLGTTIYLGFATKMSYMTACGILNKNLEPDKWTMDDEEDGRIAIHVRMMSNGVGVLRLPPINRLRHLMSTIGYEEGKDWWVEDA